MIAMMFLLCFLAIPPIALADSFADNAASLRSVTKEINTVKSTLDVDQKKYDALENSLKETEIKLSELSRTHMTLTKDIKKSNALLKQLWRKQKKNKKIYHQQKQKFIEQIRIGYKIGDNAPFKLLLNQSNLSDINRTLYYLEKINKSRIHSIVAIRKTISTLQKTARQMYHEKKHYIALRKKNDALKHSLAKQQNFRKQLLSDLSGEIKSRQQRLVILNQNKLALSTLLDTLSENMAAPQPTNPFSYYKGTIPAPVRGHVIETFGETIKHSTLKSNGIVIEADYDAPVKAIFPGEIIFADWLRGYGLLIIVDHGDNFISLYARNHVLYKDAGDNVSQDEIIATVGHSGGFETAGLYFELRHEGVPLDPKQWTTI